MPTGSWMTMPSSRRCTKRSASDIPRAAAAGGMVSRRRWCCDCSFSSTSATGALKCSSAKSVPISSTATLLGSAAARCRTPRPWGGGAWRWVGPEAIKQVHERMVTITQDQGVVKGRRMRVDTTVVETNIHYPTDSSLLGDGVRVLIRTMKKITKIAGEVGTKLRDRSHSVKRRVFDIARAARSKAKQRSERLTRAYDQLLSSSSRVVGQAKRFSAEIAAGVKQSTNPLAQLKLEGLRRTLDDMMPRVKQV